MKLVPTVAAMLVLASPAFAECYTWPLRTPLTHDGDTVYLTIPGLPKELRDVSVRLMNIDAPELHGKCPAEKVLAVRARDALRVMLADASEVITCPVGWDKYGGRIDAQMWADDVDVGEELVRRGLARAYDGGKRGEWCD